MSKIEQRYSNAIAKLEREKSNAIKQWQSSHQRDKALMISGWDRHFVVAQSKGIKNPTWFPQKNNYDSAGVIETLCDQEGMRHLGGWFLLQQLASKQLIQGLFLSDSGKCISIKHLALILRCDLKQLTEAVDHFLAIGWLEWASASDYKTSDSSDALATLEQDSSNAHSLLDIDNIKLDKIKEENTGIQRARECTNERPDLGQKMPTAQDCLEYAKTTPALGGLTLADAQSFLACYPSGRDSNGKPIVASWKAKLAYWWRDNAKTTTAKPKKIEVEDSLTLIDRIERGEISVDDIAMGRF